MAKKGAYKSMDISDIINYAENPRHDVGTSEIDTIKKLINKVGSTYMYNLAKDIYENGLIGSNLPTLVYNQKNRKYIVYEGNRRVACLKFLANPDILSTIDASFKQRIENLVKKDDGAYSTEIQCYITNEEEALLIMERTHSGEDKGRGLKAWSPKEKGVFQRRLKQKNSTALAIVDLTEKYLKEDVLSKISFSTIQRFFNNREVKKALQIDGKESNDITKKDIVLINYLIDAVVIESEIKEIALTRLLNTRREIEDFFLPLIEEYKNRHQESDDELNDKDKVENPQDEQESDSEEQNRLLDKNENDDEISDQDDDHKGKGDEEKLKITLRNEGDSGVYYTNQTINLFEKIAVSDSELFDPRLLDIECPDLRISNGVVQPDNLSGEYNVVFKYYMDHSKTAVYWQNSLRIIIKPQKISTTFSKPQTVLSQELFGKYHDQLSFEHSDKVKSLMYFLANESKNGKYSYFINIVSRMFLEYTFRLYASKVLKDDNQTVDDRSKSLQGLIDYCCIKIEQKFPRQFVKHVQRGRKEATNKVDLLQKSVHYFDVTISNDDIQVMFLNLNPYLDCAYEEIISEQFQKTLRLGIDDALTSTEPSHQ